MPLGKSRCFAWTKGENSDPRSFVMDLRVFFFFFNLLVSLIIDVLRRRLGQGRRFGLNTETLQEMGIHEFDRHGVCFVFFSCINYELTKEICTI